MELRSAESLQGCANIPREFYQPDSSSLTECSAIKLLGAVRVSERARPEPKALACLRPVPATIKTEVSAEVRPREFSRRGSSAAAESVASLGFNSVAVSGRAGSVGRKSQRSTPTPNQPMERTAPCCALRCRSSAR